MAPKAALTRHAYHGVTGSGVHAIRLLRVREDRNAEIESVVVWKRTVENLL